jgi:hypothetical protein
MKMVDMRSEERGGKGTKWGEIFNKIPEAASKYIQDAINRMPPSTRADFSKNYEIFLKAIADAPLTAAGLITKYHGSIKDLKDLFDKTPIAALPSLGKEGKEGREKGVGFVDISSAWQAIATAANKPADELRAATKENTKTTAENTKAIHDHTSMLRSRQKEMVPTPDFSYDKVVGAAF